MCRRMTIILLFFLLEKKEIYVKPGVSIPIPVSLHFDPFLTTGCFRVIGKSETAKIDTSLGAIGAQDLFSHSTKWE